MEEIKNILVNHLNINLINIVSSYFNFTDFSFTIDKDDFSIKADIKQYLLDYRNSLLPISKFIVKENIVYLLINATENIAIKFKINADILFPDFVKKIVINISTIELIELMNKVYQISYFRNGIIKIYNTNMLFRNYHKPDSLMWGIIEISTNDPNITYDIVDVNYELI